MNDMNKYKVSAVVVYQDDGEGFNNWLLEEFGILRKNNDFIDNVLLYCGTGIVDDISAKTADISNYSPSNPVNINKVITSNIDTVIVGTGKLEYEHIDELIELSETLGFTLYVVYPVRYYVPEGRINISLGSSSHVDIRRYDEVIPIVTRNKPEKIGQTSVVVLPATVYTYTHNGKSPNAVIMRDGMIMKRLYLPKIVNDFRTTPLQSELRKILNEGYLLGGHKLIVQHEDILPVDEDMLYDWLDYGGDIQINYITNDRQLTTYAPSDFVIKSLWVNVKVL